MQSNLAGFQKYLVDKGFKRFYLDKTDKKLVEIENYDSVFLGDYRTGYSFTKDNKRAYWGLWESSKPPTMFLGFDKINLIQLDWEECEENNIDWFVNRTEEEGYRIVFQQITDYDLIYEVFMSEDLIFNVDCTQIKPVVTIVNKSQLN